MDGQNWYGYARNNPLRYNDPTGLTSTVNLDYRNYGVDDYQVTSLKPDKSYTQEQYAEIQDYIARNDAYQQFTGDTSSNLPLPKMDELVVPPNAGGNDVFDAAGTVLGTASELFDIPGLGYAGTGLGLISAGRHLGEFQDDPSAENGMNLIADGAGLIYAPAGAVLSTVNPTAKALAKFANFLENSLMDMASQFFNAEIRW